MANKNNPVERNSSVEIHLPENLTNYLTPAIIFISALMISGTLIYSANRLTNPTTNQADNVKGATDTTNPSETGETEKAGEPNYALAYDYAKELGLNKDKVKKCVENGDFSEEISTDLSEGQEAGIQGTPGFIIGKLKDNTVSGTLVAGAYPYEVFEALIKKELGKDYDESVLSEYDFETGSTKINDEPVLGNRKAKIAIVEYSDYECPFCQRHALDTGKKLEENYINKDKVLWVFKDYPLSFHDPVATKEAAIANCAYKLGGDEAYFAMHDFIFENTKTNGEGL